LSALLAGAEDARVLHFACHGEFDAQSPLLSRLHIGPGAVLTGQEILQSLRLRCDLVTLSACESGLSRVQRGDELYGLVRAFLYAGAPAVVASLWRVNDCATLILMAHFYTALAGGMAVGRALQQAQLYIKTLSRGAALASLQQLLPGRSEATFGLPPGGDDAPVFADARYWAAFILVGDPARRLR
jgi:CHAT domain-containing protein